MSFRKTYCDSTKQISSKVNLKIHFRPPKKTKIVFKDMIDSLPVSMHIAADQPTGLWNLVYRCI